MKKITHIHPGSLAKVLGLLYGVLGLIGGVIFFVVSLVGVATGSHAAVALGVGIAFLIGIPLGYGVMGLILGYVMAWIYNFAAKRVGGVAFEVE